MVLSSASKKKLAIWAVALALGGGTLTASAEACLLGEGYGYRNSAAPAARVTASAAMDGGALAWVGEEVWAGDVEAWVGEEVWAGEVVWAVWAGEVVWAVWAGEVEFAAEIYIEVADRTNSVRHFFQ